MPILRFFIQNASIFVLAGILIALTFGCVTTHYGHEYKYGDESLVVSCSKDTGIRHDRIKSVSCVFENTSTSWIAAKVTDFSPAKSEDDFAVLSPRRISSFLEAYQYEDAQDRHNRNLVLAGLIVGGAALSSESPAMGLGTVVAASTVGTMYETEREFNKANGGMKFAEKHMLGGEFEIPPRSYIRRSVLIEPSSSEWPRSIKLCLQSDYDQLSVEKLAICQDLAFWDPRERVR